MNKNFVANDVTQLFPSDESFDALASIIGCMDYGIAMARKDGKFVIWNRKAYEILGKTEADVGSNKWSEHYGIHYPDTQKIVPEEDLPLVKAIKGQHVEKQELLVVNENMKDRYIVCDADPIIHNGLIMGGVVVFRDITKEKELEKKLRDMLKNLEDLKDYQDKILERISK